MNELEKLNPRNVVVSSPEEISNMTEEVIETERNTIKATEELRYLNQALSSFSLAHSEYKKEAEKTRSKMLRIAKDL